jgi:hypothetical protein
MDEILGTHRSANHHRTSLAGEAGRSTTRSSFRAAQGRSQRLQDLPHCGAGDRVAEFDEFALHVTVPPRRIVGRDADHEFPDRGCGGRSSGSPPAGVVPFAGDQAPMPGEQRRRGHHEHLTPPAAGDQPGQCRKPHPVARLVADPAGLAAQHRVLVPVYQEFGVLGHLTPGYYHQTTEQTANEQVDDRKDHSAMIPTRLAAQARSTNRAPQQRRPAEPPRGEQVRIIRIREHPARCAARNATCCCRDQMLGQHLSVQKLPVRPLETLHDTIIPGHRTRSRQTHCGLRPFSAGF